MDKDHIAELFEEIALLLEIKGENPFKARAYSVGARVLESFEGDFETAVMAGDFSGLPKLGPALRDKVTELMKTGRLAYLEDLRATLPAGLMDIIGIPGLGPKKIRVLYEDLGIDSLEALEAACHAHQIADLKGFGAKTEEKILAGIAQQRSYRELHRNGDVLEDVLTLLELVRHHPDVVRAELAGDLRRGMEIVAGAELVVSSKSPAAVLDHFKNLPEVKDAVDAPHDSARAVTTEGLPVTLHVVPDSRFSMALRRLTGSKEHNAKLVEVARAKDLTLRDDGLYKGVEAKAAQPVPLYTEEELYRTLGLDFIPPELREDRGEIEAAAKGKIPRLIEWTQLRGTFHCHTNASDGKNTLAEMAGAAQGLGMEYLGIADHSKASFQANGLSEERVLEQCEAITKLNKTIEDLHVFSGSEVDILADGRMDFTDETMGKLDYVVASVHAALTQSEEEMTKRVIRAMENPYVTMLGHPTGRMLLVRESSKLNVGKVIDCAAETGTWIELNCNAWRLELDWRWWREARDKGVRCVINPDAHRISAFGNLRLGVTMARKGWLRAEDVLNTRPLAAMTKLLREKRGKFGVA